MVKMQLNYQLNLMTGKATISDWKRKPAKIEQFCSATSDNSSK